jgi:glutamate dehydrogenase
LYFSLHSGYHTPVFPGKAAQRQKVEAYVLSKGFLPKDLVALEVAWFYDNLGIEVRTICHSHLPASPLLTTPQTSHPYHQESYFANESHEVITDHIIALYAAKTLAYTKHSNELVIELEKLRDDGALFIHTSRPGVSVTTGPGAHCEKRSAFLTAQCEC